MSSFTKKAIEARLALSSGSFTTEGNTKIIRGLPIQVTVDKVGAPDVAKASVKIFNMKLAHMEQLTTLSFRPLEGVRNTIEILAGDEESGNLSTLFAGEITLAFANFASAPDITFDVSAMTGAYPMQIAIPPTSIQDNVKVADIISKLASEAGYAFKNEGVTDSIKNSYICGSPIEQILQIARQIDAKVILDDGVITLLKPNTPREGSTPLITPSSGLIGYPGFNDTGIILKSIYNPDYQMGGKIQVESIVPKATGTWMITKLTHNLSAYMPSGGMWESQIEGAYIG